MEPLVTVLIPAYNAEKTLEAALDSVRFQTYSNLEILLINDGSTDRTREIGLKYSRMDSRILYIEGHENKKLVKVLNQGLWWARGKYIARMDADDICRPERIRKQVDFMESHPEVDICGSWVRTFGGAWSRVWRFPKADREIKMSLMYTCVLSHPAVMFRTESVVSHGIKYKEDYLYAEDYELWCRCMGNLVYYNLQEVLLDYRVSPTQISTNEITHSRQAFLTNKIISNNVKTYFGLDMDGGTAAGSETERIEYFLQKIQMIPDAVCRIKELDNVGDKYAIVRGIFGHLYFPFEDRWWQTQIFFRYRLWQLGALWSFKYAVKTLLGKRMVRQVRRIIRCGI